MTPRQAITQALAQGITFTKSKGMWFWMHKGKKVPPGYCKKSQAAYAALKVIR
jgi:hypothetical protein